MAEPVEFRHPACNSGDTRLPGRMSPSSLDGYLPGCSLKHTLDKQHKGATPSSNLPLGGENPSIMVVMMSVWSD